MALSRSDMICATHSDVRLRGTKRLSVSASGRSTSGTPPYRLTSSQYRHARKK